MKRLTWHLALPLIVASGCIVPLQKNDKPGYGPGTPGAGTAPTIGQTTASGTAPPAPAGSVNPVAVITAPDVAIRADSFVVSGTSSSLGSGNKLTYTWTISAAPADLLDTSASNPKCIDPARLSEPSALICLASTQGKVTVGLTVNNGIASHSTQKVIDVQDSSVIESLGNSASLSAAARRGGDVLLRATETFDNREAVYPKLPLPESGVLEVEDWNGNGQITEDDICRKAQGYPKGTNVAGTCVPGNTPPQYRTVHIKSENGDVVTKDAFNIDMAGFNNAATGLRIRELRFVSQPQTQSAGSITIANVPSVVFEQDVSLSPGGSVTITTGIQRIFINKLFRAKQGNVGLKITVPVVPANVLYKPELIVLGQIDTSSDTPGTAGGEVYLDATTAGLLVVGGSIKSSGGPGGKVILNGKRVEYRRFRSITTSGGQSGDGAAAGDGGDVFFCAATDVSPKTNCVAATDVGIGEIFIPNTVVRTFGGNKTMAGAAGIGGDLNIMAVNTLVMGFFGKPGTRLIETLGGSSSTTGGALMNITSGNVLLRTSAGAAKAGIFGVGGQIITDGSANTAAATAAGMLGGNAGKIEIFTNSANTVSNSIAWIGDLRARGGDSSIGTGGGNPPYATAPGTPGTVELVATAVGSSQIDVQGSILTRHGRGVGGAACAKLNKLTAVATNGSSSIVVSEDIDSAGGFVTGDTTTNNPQATGLQATGLAAVPAASELEIDFAGKTSADTYVKGIKLYGGGGESGGAGCRTRLRYNRAAMSADGYASLQVDTLNVSGGSADESGDAGDSGNVDIQILNGQPARFDLTLPSGINAKGGEQKGAGSSSRAGNGASGGRVALNLQAALQVFTDIGGDVDVRGGDAGAAADDAANNRVKRAGLSGSFVSLVGTDAVTNLIDFRMKKVLANAGSATSGSGTNSTVTAASAGLLPVTVGAPAALAPRANTTPYAVGATVTDAVNLPAGLVAVCVVAGTSAAASTFTMGNLPGARVTDGTVTWVVTRPLTMAAPAAGAANPLNDTRQAVAFSFESTQFATVTANVGDVNVNGGNSGGGTDADGVVTQTAIGGNGGSVVLVAKANGNYTFGNFNLAGGNALTGVTTVATSHNGGSGGSFTFHTDAGEPSTVVLGAIDSHGGSCTQTMGSTAATGGSSGALTFNIPTPITIGTKDLNVQFGTSSCQTAGTSVSVKHFQGPPDPLIWKIKCPSVATSATNPWCIDQIFECSAGKTQCHTINGNDP